MNTENKTHYRKAFNSPYLSSADIVEPTIFTIQRVELLKDFTKRTQDSHNTAFFLEKEIRPGELLKPMILNATNSRTMKNLSGSAFIDDWNNIPVTIYVDHNVKNRGEVVDGLRISTEPPRMQKEALVPKTKAWDRAVVAYQRDGNLTGVKKHRSISKENETLLIKQATENVD